MLLGVHNVIKVKSAGMDPVSVMACRQASAGIPKKGAKEMPPARSCSGYTSAQQSSGWQAWEGC